MPAIRPTPTSDRSRIAATVSKPLADEGERIDLHAAPLHLEMEVRARAAAGAAGEAEPLPLPHALSPPHADVREVGVEHCVRPGQVEQDDLAVAVVAGDVPRPLDHAGRDGAQ